MKPTQLFLVIAMAVASVATILTSHTLQGHENEARLIQLTELQPDRMLR